MSAPQHKTAGQLRREAGERGRPGVSKDQDAARVRALREERRGYEAKAAAATEAAEKARWEDRVAQVDAQIRVWGGPDGRRAPARQTAEA